MSLNLDKTSWAHVRFGDVVRNVNNTTKRHKSRGIDRVIAMEHMVPGELMINRWGEVSEGTTFTRVVSPGQTLFGKRRAYQRKVAYAEFDAICSGDIYTFEAVEDELLPEILPFLVQSEKFFDHALGTSAGSLSPRTNWRDLANFEFDLPPIDEQRRLADLLWAVEAAQRSCTKQLGKLEAARQTWLNGKVSVLLKGEVVPFSKTWLGSPESGYSAAPVDGATGRYVLSLAALGPSGYRQGNLKNVPDTDKIRAKALSKGDLLISRANTVDAVGRAGIFPESRDDVSFPDTMMRVNLLADFKAEFVAAIVGSSHGRKHMRRTAAGSATSMVKINRASLGRMPFPAASVDDQALLLDGLSVFEHAKESLFNESEKYVALRSSFLNEVFGGN